MVDQLLLPLALWNEVHIIISQEEYQAEVTLAKAESYSYLILSSKLHLYEEAQKLKFLNMNLIQTTRLHEVLNPGS